ncbi:prolyl 4-hydroxylase-like [Raphidocelis subcapitata]|uniref:procollagen-proline 4-dioxygenase n=1 Tax=Raphidocelis subcapitata TaxID=307507 RepID=A0A2V0NYP5_9CHLO|nr:prolyl 4-hydroxylase-like [Raphidocelis subcapitata]|eukprot:GBF92736.1 prolyl 4-hydroxylase-like [Raphidocelis subcapitata]
MIGARHRSTAGPAGGALLLLLLAAATARAAAPAAPLNVRTPVGYAEKEEEWHGEVVHLSWKPRAFLYKNFLTDEECEHIKAKATGQLRKSSVVDNETGEERDSEVRTSSGTFFDKGADEVIARIERRVAQVTMLPVDNQEGLQVLKYVDGQKYEPHYDYFFDAKNQAESEGGQRIVTALMYLATPEEGGETVFPDAAVAGPQEGLSACARVGLANKPYKGDMLVFYSLTPGGETDPSSLHASCPTLKGEKWSATKWIHVSGFRTSADVMKAKWAGCVDQSEHCAAWAATGECDRNAAYMAASCRLACGLCTPQAKGEQPAPPAPLES